MSKEDFFEDLVNEIETDDDIFAQLYQWIEIYMSLHVVKRLAEELDRFERNLHTLAELSTGDMSDADLKAIVERVRNKMADHMIDKDVVKPPLFLDLTLQNDAVESFLEGGLITEFTESFSKSSLIAKLLKKRWGKGKDNEQS